MTLRALTTSTLSGTRHGNAVWRQSTLADRTLIRGSSGEIANDLWQIDAIRILLFDDTEPG
jgi:hypothetical protein